MRTNPTEQTLHDLCIETTMCQTNENTALVVRRITSDLEVDGSQCNLYVILKQSLFFYDFFCGWYSLLNWFSYNNLFQIVQHRNFRNLNRWILTQWKHPDSQVNAFWYHFKVIKRYIFHYLMQSVLIPGSQSFFVIL